MGHISQIGFDGPLHRRTRRGVVADGIALLQGLIDRTGHRGMDGKGHHRSNLGEWTMADGDNLILGLQNDATNETTLHRASANGPGSALFVVNDNGQAIQGTGGANLPGVSGFSESGDGVRATSTNGNGLSARSTNSVAIFAESANSTGVLGIGHSQPGVAGNSDSGDGVRATSTNGNGLSARSTNSVAIFAESASSTGVLGIGHSPPRVPRNSDSRRGRRATSPHRK